MMSASVMSTLSSTLLRSLRLTASTRQISSTACLFGIKSRWMRPMLEDLYWREKKMKQKGIQHKLKRSEYIEWNYNAELYAFGKRLGEQFDDNLLRHAMIDSSYIRQETKRQEALGVESPALSMESNDKLSSAGREVITDYVNKYLHAAFPLLPEEGIRALLEYLTSEERTSELGLGIGLKDLILSEEHPPSPATLSRCFQAVVGALNASSGIDKCHIFVRDFVVTQLVGKDIADIWQVENPLDCVRDILERSGRGEPEPRLIFRSGQNTIEAVYQVGIYSDKQQIGTGYGETVSTAVEMAAHDVLKRFFKITDSRDPLSFGKNSKTDPLKNTTNMSLEDWSIDKATNIVKC